MRTTDHKLSGWIDMIFDLIVKQVSVFLILCFYTWYQDTDDILFNFFLHFGFRIKIIMLGGNYDSIYAYRLIMVIVLQCNLAFCIRAKIFDQLVFSSQYSQFYQ